MKGRQLYLEKEKNQPAHQRGGVAFIKREEDFKVRSARAQHPCQSLAEKNVSLLSERRGSRTRSLTLLARLGKRIENSRWKPSGKTGEGENASRLDEL